MAAQSSRLTVRQAVAGHGTWSAPAPPLRCRRPTGDTATVGSAGASEPPNPTRSGATRWYCSARSRTARRHAGMQWEVVLPESADRWAGVNRCRRPSTVTAVMVRAGVSPRLAMRHVACPAAAPTSGPGAPCRHGKGALEPWMHQGSRAPRWAPHPRTGPCGRARGAHVVAFIVTYRHLTTQLREQRTSFDVSGRGTVLMGGFPRVSQRVRRRWRSGRRSYR
jgi:hypothetical protein